MDYIKKKTHKKHLKINLNHGWTVVSDGGGDQSTPTTIHETTPLAQSAPWCSRDETDEWQGSGRLISYQLNKEFIFLAAAVNTTVLKN